MKASHLALGLVVSMFLVPPVYSYGVGLVLTAETATASKAVISARVGNTPVNYSALRTRR